MPQDLIFFVLLFLFFYFLGKEVDLLELFLNTVFLFSLFSIGRGISAFLSNTGNVIKSYLPRSSRFNFKIDLVEVGLPNYVLFSETYRKGYLFEETLNGLEDVFHKHGYQLSKDRVLDEEWQLYEHQKQCIGIYTGDELYNHLNVSMLNDNISEYSHYIKTLDYAIFHGKKKYNGDTVYRKMELKLELINKYTVGKIFKWHNFVSTTKNKKVAQNWPGNVLFIIYLNNEINQLDIQKLSKIPSEEEVLLTCCLTYEVLKSFSENEITIRILPNGKSKVI